MTARVRMGGDGSLAAAAARRCKAADPAMLTGDPVPRSMTGLTGKPAILPMDPAWGHLVVKICPGTRRPAPR